MPTLHSFIRWSTPEQSLKTSEQRQIARLRDWATREGWDFSEKYRAPGISGYRGKHRRIGGLKDFLADLRRGDIPQGDALGVENFDRLDREPTIDALDLFREIIRSGAGIVANGILFTEQKLREQSGLWHVVIAEMNRAHEESLRKGSAVSGANDINRRNAASKSRALHGRNCPRWLMPIRVEPRDPIDWYDGPGDQGTAYHIIPERRLVLHRIIRLALDGFGVRKIAAILNADGVATWEWRTRKRPENPQWHGNYIAKTLRNRALIGWVQPEKSDEKGNFHPEGDPLEGHYPRIISDGEFDRLQAALTRRRTFSGGRNAGKLPNLVSGLCVCSICKGRVRYKEQPTTKNGKTYVKEYLVCVNAKEGGCPNREGFPYRVLEATLIDYPRLSIAIAAMIEQQPTDQGARIAVMEDELAQVQRRRTRLMANFIDADDEDPLVHNMVAELRAEEKGLDARLVELRREQSLRQHDADEYFLTLFYEAKGRLGDPDPEVANAARRVLYDQYHQRIARVWLDANRRLRILLNPTAEGQFEIGLFSARYSRSIRGERTMRMIRENATESVPLDQTELERIERVERFQRPFENYYPEKSGV